MKEWLAEMFVVPSSTQTIILLTLVAGIGLLLSKVRIRGISLGITFVFFVGILLASLGAQVETHLVTFTMSLGLALFVYALGVEVGPSFFASLRSRGIYYNLYGLLLIVLGYVVVLFFYGVTDISMPNLLGIMSGAVTNTPVLAAVQSTLASIYPGHDELLSQAAMATAISYPLGAVGVILVLVVLNKFSRSKEGERWSEAEFRTAYIVEYSVLNPAIYGRSVRELTGLAHKHFIISRLWRGEELIMPTSQTVVQEGDHMLILCHEEDAGELELFFGKRDDRQDWNRPDVNWDDVDARLSSKRVIITNPKLNGVKLGALKLRNKYGINITRIDRAGIELLPSPDLYLQTGDRLVIVGEAGALSQAEKVMGNSIEMLDKPRLISFFLGLCLGCLLGSIPIFIPGVSVPVKLGLAGGPIVVGILVGAFGPRLHLSTYMTNSATQLIKQLGIVLYLAGLGLTSGGGFVDTLLRGDGLMWLAMGFVITVVPTLLTGLACMRLWGRSFAETAGVLCGAMANPFALDYAVELTQSRASSTAYATVYPVGIFVRIISAQLLLLLCLG